MISNSERKTTPGCATRHAEAGTPDASAARYPSQASTIPYHTGAGPVCWQKCPDIGSGWKNKDTFCSKNGKVRFKKSYGRGAGKAMTCQCRADEEAQGGLCYRLFSSVTFKVC